MTTPETKWTPEPWAIEDDVPMKGWNHYAITARHVGWDSWMICSVTPMHLKRETDEANAQRIVACVNACASMQDPAAEIAAMREALQELLAVFKPEEEHHFQARDRALNILGGAQ